MVLSLLGDKSAELPPNCRVFYPIDTDKVI
jgi:hypothetical protein